MANPQGINQYTGKGGKAAKAKRITILENRLHNFTTKAPLREKAATVKELRSLGWGRK